MAKKSALIFDIDGTALDSPTQKLPTNRLVAAIRAIENNYYICAATGRPWQFAQDVLQGMGLVDPCIISGGTQICNPRDGRIVWQCAIEPEDVKKIKAVLLKYKGHRLIVNDFSEDDYFNGGCSPEELNTEQAIFFADYVFVPDTIAAEIAAELKQIPGITCVLATAQKPGHRDIHITNRIATKEYAVAELLKMIGVEKSNTWGFGDALNDIHLFRAVHTKIAMGNAVQELKDMADEVIPSVTDDGLAWYFERLRNSHTS